MTAIRRKHAHLCVALLALLLVMSLLLGTVAVVLVSTGMDAGGPERQGPFGGGGSSSEIMDAGEPELRGPSGSGLSSS